MKARAKPCNKTLKSEDEEYSFVEEKRDGRISPQFMTGDEIIPSEDPEGVESILPN